MPMLIRHRRRQQGGTRKSTIKARSRRKSTKPRRREVLRATKRSRRMPRATMLFRPRRPTLPRTAATTSRNSKPVAATTTYMATSAVAAIVTVLPVTQKKRQFPARRCEDKAKKEKEKEKVKKRKMNPPGHYMTRTSALSRRRTPGKEGETVLVVMWATKASVATSPSSAILTNGRAIRKPMATRQRRRAKGQKEAIASTASRSSLLLMLLLKIITGLSGAVVKSGREVATLSSKGKSYGSLRTLDSELFGGSGCAVPSRRSPKACGGLSEGLCVQGTTVSQCFSCSSGQFEQV
mmetsp:Transcript_21769/g.32563  ORF Transcript_21769/g.32563 Transcript_21769/m.32563 type:complete len:294 (+) Transcript_21769:139-1020(+)